MTWRLAAVLFLLLAAACGRASPEDGSRAELLASDPLLNERIDDLEPLGPVTTVVGHGSGPAVVNNEAQRRYRTTLDPRTTAEQVASAAEGRGWAVAEVGQGSGGWVVRGSRVTDRGPVALTAVALPGGGITMLTIILRSPKAGAE